MKVTLESTTQIVNMNGIDCRVWEGVTERGVKVHAFIPRIAVQTVSEDATAQFEAELKEQKPPSVSWPLRMIL